MLDFIKNNKIIFGAVTLLLLIILGIVTVLLLASTNTGEPETQDPFANTESERNLPYSPEDNFLFGTSSERFVVEGATGTVAPEFRALTNKPITGASVYVQTEQGKEVEYVRYTTAINGHIFDTTLATLSNETSVSNNTIPKIGNTKWSSNGVATISRYFKEGDTQMFAYISYTTTGTSSAVTAVTFSGRPVIEKIQDVAFSPKGDELFYLVTNEAGSVGYIENTKSGARTQIWSSLLQKLTVSWESEDMILIYTNPSSIAEGVVWTLDPYTKKTNILLGNNKALAAKSNQLGTKVLYSLQEPENKIFSLRILDVRTGKTTHLPLATMVEKCAWGPNDSKYVYCAIPRNIEHGEFLEDWYMGKKNSDDMIWRLDSETGVVQKLIDPVEETEEQFDITDIVVSPLETYVLFKTRVNNIPWALELPEKIISTTADDEYSATNQI